MCNKFNFRNCLMKNSFLVLFTLFVASSGSVLASEMTYKVIKTHAPGEFGEHYSLFMNSGEIYDLKESNSEALKVIEESIKNNVSINLEIIKSNKKISTRALVVSASKIDNSTYRESNFSSHRKEYYKPQRHRRLMITSNNPLSNYNLTTFRSYEIAQEVMNVFNGGTHDDSECYARAHMWTYEAFLKYGDNLGKVWIFFGDKYIREFKHKWWFHVAPYTRVQNYSMPLVLDRGFTKSPYQLENWKNIFIENKASCRTIYRYSEYTRNTNREYCFLMFSSAYYWQPRDLEALGKSTRNFRWGYVMRDLDWSYNDALGTTGVKAPYARGREGHNAYRN